jgi:hypothetical protein
MKAQVRLVRCDIVHELLLPTNNCSTFCQGNVVIRNYRRLPEGTNIEQLSRRTQLGCAIVFLDLVRYFQLLLRVV